MERLQICTDEDKVNMGFQGVVIPSLSVREGAYLQGCSLSGRIEEQHCIQRNCGMPRETVTWAKVDRIVAVCPAKEMLKLSADEAVMSLWLE